jgi:hypothetical protein
MEYSSSLTAGGEVSMSQSQNVTRRKELWELDEKMERKLVRKEEDSCQEYCSRLEDGTT